MVCMASCSAGLNPWKNLRAPNQKYTIPILIRNMENEEKRDRFSVAVVFECITICFKIYHGLEKFSIDLNLSSNSSPVITVLQSALSE